MIKEVNSEVATRDLGEQVGRRLAGGELIELVGDVGAGKTTFVKGLARGLGVDEDVQSPSFTISRVYEARDGLTLAHYDFYRLADAGIMADELSETAKDGRTITVIEWGGIVDGVLPSRRLVVTFTAPDETVRRLEFSGDTSLVEEL